MLKRINIKNLVLIESAEIELKKGLTIISGETGAGKTAFTQAIALALGTRSDFTLIRKGANMAVVEATFNDLVIRRELTKEGKSRCFINDGLVTLSTLQNLGKTLIDLNTQHENKELLSSETHRTLLDLYGEIDLVPFTAAYEKQKQLEQKLEELEELAKQKAREEEFIQAQVEELSGVDFSQEEALFEEYKKLASIQEVFEKSEQIQQHLETGIGHFARAKTLLQNTHIEEALIHAKEALREIHTSLYSLETSPQRFAYLEERLSKLAKLKRKYGNNLSDIAVFKKGLEEKLSLFANLEMTMEETRKELKQIDTASLAAKITDGRKKGAKTLEEKITLNLKTLNMPEAEFKIQITEESLSSHGQDRVEFALKTNKGEPLLKVKECSSGGELSRLMLVLKTTLAEKNHTPTLVFDEIDANVGGETAAIMGEMLHTLGKDRQVLCITHFPQVAKKADQNLRVYKQESEERTVGFIEPLDKKGKEKELIRMLGGALALLCISPLSASDYSFVVPEKHVHIQGDYRPIAAAHVRKGGDLHYADSSNSLFLSHFLNDENALSWQLGYNYMKADWKENPKFSQTDFNYVKAALGYISTAMDCWRWILNAGVNVDATTLNFGKSGVYTGFFWGRYHFNNCLGVHVGLGGYAGVRNAYCLPIFGIDLACSQKWQFHAIFPIDLSLEYFFAKDWSTELAYVGFGGPYRFPFRVHNGDILEIHSTGIEWDLNYDCNQRFNPEPCDKWINASIGIGWNFGGWMFVKNSHNHHGKYYHYNSAPYAQAELALNF